MEVRRKYFTWTDKSKVDYLWGWAKNRPELDIKGSPGNFWTPNYCAVMVASDDYRWYDEVCNKKSFRALCQVEKGKVLK